MRYLLSGISFCRCQWAAYFGNEKLVGLLQFLEQETIEAIFKLNSVVVVGRREPLSHAFVSAAKPRGALG
jgi:hypothetical protein